MFHLLLLLFSSLSLFLCCSSSSPSLSLSLSLFASVAADSTPAAPFTLSDSSANGIPVYFNDLHPDGSHFLSALASLTSVSTTLLFSSSASPSSSISSTSSLQYTLYSGASTSPSSTIIAASTGGLSNVPITVNGGATSGTTNYFNLQIFSGNGGATTWTYDFMINVQGSLDLNLASILVSSGTTTNLAYNPLPSPFSPLAIRETIATIATETSLNIMVTADSANDGNVIMNYYTLNPTSSSSTAFILSSGTQVVDVDGTARVASGKVPIAVGLNVIQIIVNSIANPAATQTYTIAVTRTASVNANLQSVAVQVSGGGSIGGLDTTFSPSIVTYAAHILQQNLIIANTNNQFHLIVTPADPTATVGFSINGAVVSSPVSASQSITFTITMSSPTVTAQVLVVSQAGPQYQQVYTFNFVLLPNNHFLSSLVATPAFPANSFTFTPTVQSYNVIVPYSTSSIQFTATNAAATANSQIDIQYGNQLPFNIDNGKLRPFVPIPLPPGATSVIQFILLAEDASSLTYTINIQRLASITLSSISFGPIIPYSISPTFDLLNTYSYNIIVLNSVSSISIFATKTESDGFGTISLVSVNGVSNNAVISPNGTMSGSTPSISLTANTPILQSTNTIIISMTALDGRSQSYMLTIIRATTANLVNLILKGSGTTLPLNPPFNSSYYSPYTAFTIQSRSLLTGFPTADPGSSFDPTTGGMSIQWSVNGQSVASSTATGNLPGSSLKLGDNNVVAVVTSNDRLVSLAYVFTVRAQSSSTSINPLSVSVYDDTGGVRTDSRINSPNDPVPSGGFLLYTPISATNVSITAQPTYSAASICYTLPPSTACTPLVGSAYSAPFPTSSSSTSVTLTVRSEDGTGSASYPVTITKSSAVAAGAAPLTGATDNGTTGTDLTAQPWFWGVVAAIAVLIILIGVVSLWRYKAKEKKVLSHLHHTAQSL